MTAEIDWKGLPERLKLLSDLVGGQSALGRLVELGRHTIWEFITGRRQPPVSTLQSIAALFPCSLEWLSTGAGNPPKHESARFLKARGTGAKGTVARRSVNEAELTTRVGGELARDFDPTPDLGIFDPPGAARYVSTLIRIQQASKNHVEVADRVFGPALAQEIRAGRAIPSMELIKAFASSIGISPSSLLGE